MRKDEIPDEWRPGDENEVEGVLTNPFCVARSAEREATIKKATAVQIVMQCWLCDPTRLPIWQEGEKSTRFSRRAVAYSLITGIKLESLLKEDVHIATIVDNIIALWFEVEKNTVKRKITVLKERRSPHGVEIKELSFEDGRIRVYG